ncbi:contractile injection system tape measure protein [Pleurocapsa sp. PCC 7319]|uniref:contractile injection system tape measure protein n=1 Tax=Pleurocapsa sp. PCC 7319 TaxID=118161 RepID=UPI00034D21FE|nr:contractile injection system tape measure protein [Pleurocapsa sp. PCC 7319]
MTSQRHIIKRQILDLHINSELKAFELQNKISALYRSKIIPLIESYCNQISDPEQIFRINRLEIDLGTIDEANLESDFVQKVTDALSQEFSQQRASYPPNIIKLSCANIILS